MQDYQLRSSKLFSARHEVHNVTSVPVPHVDSICVVVVPIQAPDSFEYFGNRNWAFVKKWVTLWAALMICDERLWGNFTLSIPWLGVFNFACYTFQRAAFKDPQVKKDCLIHCLPTTNNDDTIRFFVLESPVLQIYSIKGEMVVK